MKSKLRHLIITALIFVIPAITQAEVRSWTWPAAGIGMVAGGLAAGLGTYYAQSGQSLRTEIASGVGFAGAVVGGGIGALIGHAISSRQAVAVYPFVTTRSSGQPIMGFGMHHGF